MRPTLRLLAGLLLAGRAAARSLPHDGGSAVVLNNGVRMPMLAFAANVYSVDVCKSATADALAAGVRNIWSSEIVSEPCQSAQREAIDASGIQRSDLFVAGTIDNPGCKDDCYESTMSHARKQLQILSKDATLDMLMLDYPSNAGCEGIEGQWRALEELYRAGSVRVIAVSNFEKKDLECISKNKSATLPAVNQMPYNIGNSDESVLKANKALGILVQAYSPLGSGGILRNAKLDSVAKKHGKVPAQVALRWLIQQGVAVALASTKAGHFREDMDIFNFSLSEDEMREFGPRGPVGSQF